MATYLLRYYQLHYDLWDPSYKNKDYNVSGQPRALRLH